MLPLSYAICFQISICRLLHVSIPPLPSDALGGRTVVVPEDCGSIMGADRVTDLQRSLRRGEGRLEDRVHGVPQAAAETQLTATGRPAPDAVRWAVEQDHSAIRAGEGGGGVWVRLLPICVDGTASTRGEIYYSHTLRRIMKNDEWAAV